VCRRRARPCQGRALCDASSGSRRDHDVANHTEPALLLIPPETASEEDDEVAHRLRVTALKLDADWVVISACSWRRCPFRLARAFFYAGARALLVFTGMWTAKRPFALSRHLIEEVSDADPDMVTRLPIV
jgi:hypothetical protein